MLKITALVPTLLKKRPLDSSKLDPKEMMVFTRGKSYQITKWEKAPSDHIYIELAYGAGSWYAFDPHVHFPPTDDRTYVAPRTSKSKTLTPQDYVAAAEILGCSVAAVKAVVKIEANGSGFQRDGKPRILFEPHLFGKLTNYYYNRRHPHLSSYSWNRRLYSIGGTSWYKIDRAMGLNESAAIQSASYGLFQVLGLHYKICGYETPRQYYDAQFTSEFEHLRCAIAFMKSKGLDKHLQNLDWNRFAYGYNGSAYKKHGYHIRLSDAYRMYA